VASVEPLECIGAGGTAHVWHAVDPLRGAIALKVLHPELRGSRLLEHEHAVLEAVRHPNVVGTFGLVECSIGPALALEYLGGGDLVALVGAHPRTWMRAAADVAAALAHVHACGYAYRDLKARNVLLDAAGRARLIDFAAALRLGAPQPKGGTTAAYRPAVEPAAVGTREDEVALATLVYELMTGRLPFGSDGRRRGTAVPPPLPADRAAPPSLAALSALVTGVLAGAPDSGSLSQLAAVIDTVAAGFR
jgi:serine/threonine protein kinase